jgi:hypothetical protein
LILKYPSYKIFNMYNKILFIYTICTVVSRIRTGSRSNNAQKEVPLISS